VKGEGQRVKVVCLWKPAKLSLFVPNPIPHSLARLFSAHGALSFESKTRPAKTSKGEGWKVKGRVKEVKGLAHLVPHLALRARHSRQIPEKVIKWGTISVNAL
jgi:hypothetical protein